MNMAERVHKEAPPVSDDQQQDVADQEFPAINETTRTEEVEVLLEDTDELLDEIDTILESEEQLALDDARKRAEYRAKLKSISFIGKRAVDPCLEPGLIRVPEVLAEKLLSAGVAKEHDCSDCD